MVCRGSKPDSEKWLHSDAPYNHGRGTQPLPLRRSDGARYLDVRGLTVKWEKVTPVLERIALALALVDESGTVLVKERNAATLSIDQLRTLVGS